MADQSHQEQISAAKATVSFEQLGSKAADLAEALLLKSRRRLRLRDRWQARKLTRMIADPRGKALTLQLADEVFRSHQPRRSALRFRQLVRDHGIPKYLPIWERCMMGLGKVGSFIAPRVVMPLISRKMRAESGRVILPSERHPLSSYLERSRAGGVEVNLNQLGEAVLGEEEAARRLDTIVGRLRSPDVDYISVKLSAIYSQIHLVSYDQSLQEAVRRLEIIFRAAKESPYIDSAGLRRQKFVNLDMEEYSDLHLTAEAFKQVLDQPEFIDLEAGIVLQAYLPDSSSVQAGLTQWARSRRRRGGNGIKVRLVKGANLAMERIEAESHGWSLAPYDNKRSVDANFKAMVEFGCRPENVEAVRLGIGSHNLFDIAFAMLAAEKHGTSARVEFEMLEGMANHQATTVEEASSGMRMYAPLVRTDDFHSALAYLVRRLDENTSEENYLSKMLSMKVGSESWETEKQRFLDACSVAGKIATVPQRDQNRAAEEVEPDSSGVPFINAADTDWSVPANRAWLDRYLDKWQHLTPDLVRPQIDGSPCGSGAEKTVYDPSRPGHVAYAYLVADIDEVDRALDVATTAFETWNLKPFEERARLLKRVASVFAQERGDTIGCLILDGGKAVTEADAEISEAIDFANFYARSMGTEGLSSCESEGRGVVVVVPPWNFPYAIPAGGVLAALVAGNTVILKPAPEATLTGARLARQLWDAGIPRDVLQFVPTEDNEVGKTLVTDRRVDTVVLTGSYLTGKLFQSWRPRIRLLAETSGKNAMVITASADIDRAAADLVHSAFGHAGQKCSAASLAFVEEEIYHRLDFRRQLRDAAQSLAVGSAWERSSKVTPLISAPGEELARAQSHLEDGEEWLLEPRRVDNNPLLWSPGIKLGVSHEGAFFRTECFGPVLGIIPVKNLDHALELQNQSAFGLTGGIHSLDPEEISKWLEQARVGNAYVNRTMTGAIVRRQPFGGWGHSVFGSGAKAGGVNYVLEFAHWQQVGLPTQRESPGDAANEVLGEIRKRLISPKEREQVGIAAWNYGWAFQKIFSAEHDPSALRGERNVHRFRPRERLLYRLSGKGDEFSCTLAILGAAVTGIQLDLSVSADVRQEDLDAARRLSNVLITQEGDSQFCDRLRELPASERPELIRAPGIPLREMFEIANGNHIPVVVDPVLANGRLELRFWYREQSVSESTHRYGNVLPRFRNRFEMATESSATGE